MIVGRVQVKPLGVFSVEKLKAIHGLKDPLKWAAFDCDKNVFFFMRCQ